MSPLLHSEDASHLKLYIEVISERISRIEETILVSSEYHNISDAEAVISHLQSLIKFAKDHLKIIHLFGRYPHRNVILDR